MATHGKTGRNRTDNGNDASAFGHVACRRLCCRLHLERGTLTWLPLH